MISLMFELFINTSLVDCCFNIVICALGNCFLVLLKAGVVTIKSPIRASSINKMLWIFPKELRRNFPFDEIARRFKNLNAVSFNVFFIYSEHNCDIIHVHLSQKSSYFLAFATMRLQVQHKPKNNTV